MTRDALLATPVAEFVAEPPTLPTGWPHPLLREIAASLTCWKANATGQTTDEQRGTGRKILLELTPNGSVDPRPFIYHMPVRFAARGSGMG